MTKGQFIDFIREGLPGVDKTSKFHRATVAMAIEKAFNTVFYEMYMDGPKNLDPYTALETSVAVSTDSNTSRKYISLSGVCVNLPGKGSGVVSINTNTGTNLTFVPMTDMEMDQAYELDLTLPGNVTGFSVQPSRIEFYNLPSTTTTVRVRYVKAFSSYAVTDLVNIPHGQDAKIMDLVRQYLGLTPPKDLLNNNTDGQR